MKTKKLVDYGNRPSDNFTMVLLNEHQKCTCKHCGYEIITWVPGWSAAKTTEYDPLKEHIMWKHLGWEKELKIKNN